MEMLSLVKDSVLSAMYNLLYEQLNEFISEQLREQWNEFISDQPRDSMEEVRAQMESWKTLLPKIIAVLQHAEENQVANQFVKSSLDDLRDLAYDMEDILEEFVIDAKRSHHKVVAKRLPESSLLEDKVIGRDGDKDAILRRLLEDGGNPEQDFVVPIVGMGGLGKTTLARLIYNDKRLEGMFDLKAWVCVSDEFDVPQITKNILEHVTDEKFEFVFSKLQEKLKEKLSGCKFFLVLDDVWNKEYGKWDVLKRPFMSGALGSKIIVTTRNKDVGTMMRGDEGVHNLELLQDDACLPLFAGHALGKENFDVHPNLQDVGEKLVKKCKRLPLALKTFAGILRGKLHRDVWENVLKSDIWSSSEDGSGILPVLRLSYNHLSSHLKRCFAYCALFPEDYEFDKKQLVLLWMAEGLLQQQSHEKKQMEEEIGHQYFDELFLISLFQQSSGDKSRFVMHDLVNDLAVDVAGKIYCNLERSIGDEKLEKARHLSFTPHEYEMSERFIVLDKLKHLRTFLPVRGSNCSLNLSQRILHDILPTLSRLRVLSLCNYQISKLPDSIENLKHIRYIDLSRTSIECIPESVGSLLFLQTLLLCDCSRLSKLPMTIGNLIDLHHLDITYTPSLKEMPLGIGNLKNLVILSKFIVGKASGTMIKLSDLKNLLQLQGRLFILDLQNVLDVQDAREANLDKIHGLEELVLKWTTFDYELEGTTSDNDRDELVLKMQVLSWLKPHSNLKSLEISCYGGENFPPWVCDPSLFLNLSSIVLSHCKRCTLLPSLGLLPILKELIIEGMDSIETIGSEFYGQHGSFPSLVELAFVNMPKWKEWTSSAESASEFPCLHRLVIENCPKLGQLPSNLSSLKELHVIRCKSLGDLPSLTYLRIWQISERTDLFAYEHESSIIERVVYGDCNGVLLKSMSMVDLTSLTNLRIEQISKLTCLPMSMSLPSLRELSIRYCNRVLLKSMVDLTSLTNLRIEQISELTCLPMSMSLPSLKELSIRYCNGVLLKSMVDLTSLSNLKIEQISKLTCLPESFTQSWTALETLDIAYCDDLTSLESLPNAIKMRMDGSSSSNTSMLMSRLETLEIFYCDSLKSFPRGKLPTSLKYLRIRGCKGLESLPDVDVTNGGEWLESFPEKMLQHCTRLQSISIWACKRLKSLPNLDCVSNLVRLYIHSCEVLESLLEELALCTPNLNSLQIRYCKNFKSLPNTMHQLKSLQGIWMFGCHSFEFIPDGGLPPNLKQLELFYCQNLKCVPNSMCQLTSLESLSLLGEALTMDLQNLTSLRSLRIEHKLPLDIVLASSLTSLAIWHEDNLESIPGGLFQNLSSLQCLLIQSCPKLRSLPKEAFPPSLARLSIEWCPHLKRQRFEEKGDYWNLTWSIPCIRITE
ncbi:hypothetical protein SLEP1_g53358 [Rubroshorea leprosula]|uniref:Disease resistance RPP13-like protein 1 n=1 Tax=Rubroshorea leprosula TaxID=152421 RepID=A0AAV5MCQ9_9ROSI|nr:hypothetical protein SLEP1_g53358 [Rubroshorea leprosula]